MSAMPESLYSDDFSAVFCRLLAKASVTCYRVSQFTNIDQSYLSRLKNGEKNTPSPEVLMKISLALVHFSAKITLADIERLFNAVGRSIRAESGGRVVAGTPPRASRLLLPTVPLPSDRDDSGMRQGCRKASVGWTDSTPNTQVVQEPSSGIGAMTVRQAGKKGGLACSRNHGRGFYVGIGRRGQHVLRSRHPDKAREWGRMGGRPRKLTLEQIMGQASESE